MKILETDYQELDRILDWMDKNMRTVKWMGVTLHLGLKGHIFFSEN